MRNILYIHAGAELYGADIVLLNLIKGLDRSKYNPFVILPCDGLLVNKMKENNIKVEIIPYPILRRKYFNIRGVINYIYEYFKYAKKLKEKAEQYKIDIIHANTIAVLEGIYIKKKIGTKLIWHIHEILEKPKIIAKILYKLVGKNADDIIVVSNAVKAKLEEETKHSEKIQVIYNGVDNEKFNDNNDVTYLKREFNIGENAIIIGMIGRINAWKGQQDFIEATSEILEKYKNVYVMIVGGVFKGQEWRKEELQKYIAKQKYADRIILSDFREDTNNIHNLFDIFVLPSTNPDPLPTVVLEAMATKKPIVAYRHGGVCEMVEENCNGFFATVGDKKELGKAIEKMILTNYRDMGEESYLRQIKYFSLKSYIENFQRIYNK